MLVNVKANAGRLWSSHNNLGRALHYIVYRPYCHETVSRQLHQGTVLMLSTEQTYIKVSLCNGDSDCLHS
jgi:hypothetical protein